MQCVKCGASIAPGQDQCSACGSFVDARGGGTPFLPGAHGIPVSLYAPSPQGPPRSREPYATPSHIYTPQRIRGYRAIEAPAHAAVAPRPRRRLRRALILPTLLVVALVGVIVAGSAGALSGLGLLTTPGNHPQPSATMAPVAATPTSVPVACLNTTPVQAATRALNQAQLTSGLRNPAKKDYRPIDRLTEAHTSQQVYLTFRIATAAQSDVEVLVCWQQGQTVSDISFAAHSKGRYGQVPLQIPSGANGQATAIISWNGQTAAVVYFLVEP
jgi:hypothetical protein